MKFKYQLLCQFIVNHIHCHNVNCLIIKIFLKTMFLVIIVYKDIKPFQECVLTTSSQSVGVVLGMGTKVVAIIY